MVPGGGEGPAGGRGRAGGDPGPRLWAPRERRQGAPRLQEQVRGTR